jgi:hypothetical protein
MERFRRGIFGLPHTGLLMEYYLILAAFWWSIILLFPSGTFSYATGGNFTLMQDIVPLSVWGIVTSFISAFLLVSLIMRWQNWRRVMLFIHFLWWTLITIMIVKTSPFSTGTGIYGIMAVMSLYMALNHDLLPVIYRSTVNHEHEENVD